MKFTHSLFRGLVVVLVLAVIAAAVAVTLNAIEAKRAPAVAEKALEAAAQATAQGQAAAQATAQGQGQGTEPRVVVLSPDLPSRWTRFWYGDPWNRDPVCGGDPICRDAYFRDWPYARRPDRYPHHTPAPAPAPAAAPITITNTNTATAYAPAPAPSQTTASQTSTSQTSTSQTSTSQTSTSQTAASQIASQTTSQGSQGSQVSQVSSGDAAPADSPAPALPDDSGAALASAGGCGTCARRKKAMESLLRR